MASDVKDPGGRGRIGTMTAMPRFDDESYLDLVEGLRAMALRELTPRAATALRAESVGRSVALSDLRDRARTIPAVGTRNRVLHSSQGMNWTRVLASYERRRPELLAALDEAETRGPGRLVLDPEWTYPDYYASVHYHRQPGGYHDDPLAGYVYHYGTKVFHTGKNDRDEAKIERIWELPEPADGVVARTLDVACSIGAGTVAFKERWLGAEVWGIDASAPLLRYAHARAVGLGVDVNFGQQLAEDLRFDDASIDVVYMSTLLHEMPVEEGRRAVREARRVLRPEGVLVLHDMPPAATPPDPWIDFNRDFDTRFNGEPYSYDFIHSGLDALLAEQFSQVSAVPGHTMTWTCIA
jgi:SAM-dependent methyltransferase